MKGGRRTAKGRLINIDDVIAASPHSTAVGNMKVNAQGDELGPGGEVTKTREQRTRAYYKDHPQSSNRKVSLKGDMPGQMTQASGDFAGLKPDTADTGYENVRVQEEETNDYDDGTWTDPAELAAQFADLEPEDGPTELATEQQDPAELAAEPEAPEPEEFDDVEMPAEEVTREPDGYREVEQENGDIVMQPYWNDEDES